MSDTTGLCVITVGHGVDEQQQPLPREAEIGLLCAHHRRRLNTATTEIRDLWYDLTFILEANTAPKDDAPKTRRLKAAEAPAPANLEALALRDPRSASTVIPRNPAIPLHEGDETTPIPAVLSVVASWLLLFAEERPLTATRLPRSVIAQLSLLEIHHDWAAGQEWIGDYVAELDDLRKALRLAVRDVTHRKVGKCPLPIEGQDKPCAGDLIKENGADDVRCVRCGAQWTQPHERAMLSMILGTTA